jgi:hypothetical protein
VLVRGLPRRKQASPGVRAEHVLAARWAKTKVVGRHGQLCCLWIPRLQRFCDRDAFFDQPGRYVSMPRPIDAAANSESVIDGVPRPSTTVSRPLTSTIDTVFLAAVTVAAMAFALTWLLPEIRMRRNIDENSG